MHVLVATRRTQRQRRGDYSHAIDGELVTLPLAECDWGDDASFREHARYFVGIESARETTTAEVVELDVTDDVIAGYIGEALSRQTAWDPDTLAAVTLQLATEMLDIADQFPSGTVIEKRGTVLLARDARPGAGGRPPLCDSGGLGGPP